MIEMFKNLFRSKLKSGVKRIALTASSLGHDYSERVYDLLDKSAISQSLLFVDIKNTPFSPGSKVSAMNVQMHIHHTFLSFSDVDECEILYLSISPASKKLAEHYAKCFTDFFDRPIKIKMIKPGEKGFHVLAQFMNLDYNITVKPFNYRLKDEYIDAEVYAKFMAKVFRDI